MNIAIESHKELIKNLKKYVEDTFNAEYRDRKLVVEEVYIPDLDYENKEDVKAQKNAKVEGLTLSESIFFRFSF